MNHGCFSSSFQTSNNCVELFLILIILCHRNLSIKQRSRFLYKPGPTKTMRACKPPGFSGSCTRATSVLCRRSGVQRGPQGATRQPARPMPRAKQGARASPRITPGLKGRTKKEERAGRGEGRTCLEGPPVVYVQPFFPSSPRHRRPDVRRHLEAADGL